MKFLALIVMFFSFEAMAVQNWWPVGKAGARTTYTNQQNCEKKEHATCYEISKCNPEVCSLHDDGHGKKILVQDQKKMLIKSHAEVNEKNKLEKLKSYGVRKTASRDCLAKFDYLTERNKT